MVGLEQSPMCHVYMCTAASGWNATWNDDGFSQDTCFKEQTQLSVLVTMCDCQHLVSLPSSNGNQFRVSNAKVN